MCDNCGLKFPPDQLFRFGGDQGYTWINNACADCWRAAAKRQREDAVCYEQQIVQLLEALPNG